MLVGQPTIAFDEGCFPTCDVTDGRFLAVSGGEFLQTIGDEPLNLKFAVRGNAETFLIEIFDGDSVQADASGQFHWDSGTSIPVEFTLLADPTGDPADQVLVDLPIGNPFFSDIMPNNDWFTLEVTPDPIAQTPNGSDTYFYVLKIELTDTEVTTINGMKVRTDESVFLTLLEQPFSFIANWTNIADLEIVYPNLDFGNLFDPSPEVLASATYDGTFSFFIEYTDRDAADRRDFSIFDGDLDRGRFDGDFQDTDDPNTPVELPPWANPDVVSPEGVAVGDIVNGIQLTSAPPDDRDPNGPKGPNAGLNMYTTKSPSVEYQLAPSLGSLDIVECEDAAMPTMLPDGRIGVLNTNPSGNQEWEEFNLSLDPFDPTLMDCQVSNLPSGIYEFELRGMDMQNLNAWFFDANLVCTRPNGEPCDDRPKRYVIGDLVWEDLDQDTTQNGSERGLQGVLLNLVTDDGFVIESTLTDELGNYLFTVDSGTHTVEVDASNFEDPEAKGAVGDRVWFDIDRDGIEGVDEPGIGAVRVTLIEAGADGLPGTMDDRIQRRTSTARDGRYLFTDLEPGIYFSQVDEATIRGGLTLTGNTNPSATRVITSDEVWLDLDFGYGLANPDTAAVGDFVWIDANEDGIQDPVEATLGNVTLSLIDSLGAIAASTVTKSDGSYLFTGVAPGTYTVDVTDNNGVLVGFTLTSGPQSNPDPTDPFTVVAGEAYLVADFGYSDPTLYAIDDVVWFDADRNGLFDAGEAPLAGVTVALYGPVGRIVATAVTDANGAVRFEQLDDGPYAVALIDYDLVLNGLFPTTLPAFDRSVGARVRGADVSQISFGFVDTAPLTGYEQTLPTNGDPTQTFEVVDANVFDFDFGYYPLPSALGDRVWSDEDGDGNQDASEPGLNGVPVTLLDASGNPIDSQTTSGDGDYLFTDLAPGTYTVVVDSSALPPGTVQTFDLDGNLDDQASTSLRADEVFLDLDFGYNQPTGSIGDRVWEDRDGDGVQDGDEPGINDVPVDLLDETGTLLASTTTAGDGEYLFPDLTAGSYTVVVDPSGLPAGTIQTFDLDGNLDDMTTAALAAAEDRRDVDFGYQFPTASIGDRVWADNNGDGVQDADEPGIDGVPVTLLDVDGNVIASTVTAGGGLYLFPDLLAGTYTVVSDPSGLPAGTVQTFDRDGTLDDRTTVSVAPGDALRDADFGYLLPSSIGDRLWFDSNGDGAQDGGEPGINGVSLELVDAGGNVVATTTTSGDGDYLFSGLVPGTYTVVVDESGIPGDFQQTFELDGTLDGSTQVTTAAGEAILTVDFGYQPLGSIGDRLWSDDDGDGVQDAGEPGIAGIAVELLDENGNVLSVTVTNVDGIYTFDDLGAGTYTVRVVTSGLPANVTQTFDLDGVLDDMTAVALGPGEDRDDVDFGYQPLGSIGDRVWLDENSNGVQDAGEPGLNGIGVSLLDAAGGVIATTTTSGDGGYLFDGLPAATYTVQVTPPPGLDPTFDLDGVLDSQTTLILGAGEDRLDADFGYASEGSICLPTLDWETDGDGNPLVAGDIIDDEFTALGITVTTNDPIAHPLMIFDSANPTGGDFDLGTPNEDFGGPGVGDGGKAGEPGENSQPLGNVLIISEDADPTDPDDNGDGGTMTFTFDQDVFLESVGILDIDGPEAMGMVTAYDASGAEIASLEMQPLGDNSVQDLLFGIEGVRQIDIWFPASGAVTDITFCPDDCVPTLVADNFDAVSYSNNDGPDDWAGDWIEDDVAGSGPDAGNVRIENGALRLSDSPDTGTEPSAARTVDLSKVDTAQLIFDFWTSDKVDPTDAVTLEISSDGGLTYTELDVFTGFDGMVGGWEMYDVTPYISSETTIRFRVSNLYGGDGEYFAVHFVSIGSDCGALGDGKCVFNWNGDGGRAFWIPEISKELAFEPEPGTWQEFEDGTARLVGTLRDQNDTGRGFEVDMFFTGRYTDGTFDFYSDFTGTLVGWGGWEGAELDLIPRGADFQVGEGANQKDDDFGASGWFTYITISQPQSGYFPETGEGDLNVDLGPCPGDPGDLGSLGDRVWSDEDGDGVQDGGEPGISGVTVELLDEAGSVVSVTVTDVDGIYGFSELAAGVYTVRVVDTTLPPGVEQSFDLDGVLDDMTEVDLGADESRDDLDFGYQPLGSLGDRVWLDSDRDGIQDGGEPGLSGVSVELRDSAGNLLSSMTTGADGDYLFDDLAAATYQVVVERPIGREPTFDPDGQLDDMTTVTLAAGESRLDADFGYADPITASLGDRVWLDANADGVQDASEGGINDVVVELFDAVGQLVATQTTSGDGDYLFGGLLLGTYTVSIDASSLPAGLTPTFDLDGTPDGTTTVDLVGDRTDVDFGYAEPDCVPTLVADNFDAVSFSNNDGPNDWVGDWVEVDLAAGGEGPGAGNVWVENGGLRLNDYPNTGGEPSAARTVDLSGVTDATLTIDFSTSSGVDPTDAVTLEISSDGGATYTELDVFTNIDGAIVDWRHYDVSAYISAQTTIRFRVSNLYGGDWEYFSLDFVSIGSDCGGLGDGLCVFNWNGDGGRAFWIPEISKVLAFEPEPGTWQEFEDGTARLVGTLRDQNDTGRGFEVDMFFTGRYTDGTFDFYGDFTGSLIGWGGWDGAELDLVPRGKDFQVGEGANQQDGDFGASGWFTYTTVSQPQSGSFPASGDGDLNVDLGPCPGDPPGGCDPVEVRDEFNAVSFANNDGPDDWAGDWIEDDPKSGGEGPDAGNVWIEGSELRLDDYPNTGGEPSAARTVDLTGAVSATLSFDYATSSGVDRSDKVVVEISSDGGQSYSALETFTDIKGATSGSRSYDITNWISADTTVRFRVKAYYGGDWEYFSVDNVDISSTCDGGGQAACSVTGEDWLTIDDDDVEWSLTNSGESIVTIDSITISWPSDNDELEQIELDNTEIWAGSLSAPSGTVDSDWRGSIEDRQIGPGASKTLELEFDEDAENGSYTIGVEFSEGCSADYAG